MTFVFLASYSAFHIVHHTFVDITPRATLERPFGLLLLADWILLLLFSVIQLMRHHHRIGICSLATTLLFFLMLVLPATS